MDVFSQAAGGLLWAFPQKSDLGWYPTCSRQHLLGWKKYFEIMFEFGSDLDSFLWKCRVKINKIPISLVIIARGLWFTGPCLNTSHTHWPPDLFWLIYCMCVNATSSLASSIKQYLLPVMYKVHCTPHVCNCSKQSVTIVTTNGRHKLGASA